MGSTALRRQARRTEPGTMLSLSLTLSIINARRCSIYLSRSGRPSNGSFARPDAGGVRMPVGRGLPRSYSRNCVPWSSGWSAPRWPPSGVSLPIGAQVAGSGRRLAQACTTRCRAFRGRVPRSALAAARAGGDLQPRADSEVPGHQTRLPLLQSRFARCGELCGRPPLARPLSVDAPSRLAGAQPGPAAWPPCACVASCEAPAPYQPVR